MENKKCSRCGNTNENDFIVKIDGKEETIFCAECTCYKCFEPIQDHRRCKFCSALYHEKDGCCNESEITPLIKQTCFICGNPIENDIKRYVIKGNSCDSCIANVNEKLKKKKYGNNLC